MIGHTEEPWIYGDSSGANKPCITTVGWVGEFVFGVDSSPYPGGDYRYMADNAQEDVRRIVACVNACAGIDTNFLERTHAKGYASGFRKHIELENECEELRNRLAAFENGTASECARASIKAADQLKRQCDKLLEASKRYYTGYVQDEADDPACCIEGQHEAAVALRDAIAEVEGGAA